MTIQSYYNRFNTSKNYDRTMFLAGRGLQSSELNEIQENALYKLKAVGDAIFAEGDVVEGTAIVVNADTGATTIEAGRVYLRGVVRDVPGAQMSVPTDTLVRLGIYYNERTVTELEDPELRDPAVGTRNYQEPGAVRLQAIVSWGYQIDGREDEGEGEFYPVYLVENGALVIQSPPPQLDAVTAGLARYDRESNGSYVVSGFKVQYANIDDSGQMSQQVFVISEGKAHVNGYEIGFPHGLRVRFPEDPDIAEIEAEPHTFQPDAQTGVMRVQVHNAPIHKVERISITAERTVNMTHGAFSGVTDPLPDESIRAVVAVRQGDVLYSVNEDFRLTGGDLDWSPLGAEPAPGSAYQVTYQYRKSVEPSHLDENGFDVVGSVTGTDIFVDYSWKMPRFDVISMDQEGRVQRVKGLAHPWRPSAPSVPDAQLELAVLEQTWVSDVDVKTVSTAIQAVPMSDLEVMRSSIEDLYSLVAEERLRNDANAQEPTAKLGVFVDPFFDDDLRDQGMAQTAAIVDGELTLPIAADIADTQGAGVPELLPYTLEPVLEQLSRTTDMKVNPYQAFEPIPARVTLNAAVDRWTIVDTQWLSPLTQRFSIFSSPLLQESTVGRGRLTREDSRVTRNVLLNTQTAARNELLSTTSQQVEFMRQSTQSFEIDGFAPGERLERVVFDGVEITPLSVS